MTDHKEGQETHIENGLLAAYVDRRLPAAEEARVEAHLAACDDCRLEVIEVRRLLSTRARRWPVIAALGAAAVLLLVLTRPGQHTSAPSPIRGGGGPEPVAPTVLEPAVGAVVPANAVTFVWRGVEAPASYRLTLTDERGDVVWSVDTPDTNVATDSSVRFLHGRTYYWSVDVLMRDGRSTTTGFHSFRVAP
jgi:anti-sigma factor RsiW